MGQLKTWHCSRFRYDVGADALPLVMGVINVTPDSFSDGGQFQSVADVLRHAERMVYDGASILDVGGESTRPGAAEVAVTEEIARVTPVVSALSKAGHCVSIDTRKTDVMRAAIDAGASIVNDVYALRAAGALETCAKSDVGVVLMHMKGEPATMQQTPTYLDVVHEVASFLEERANAAMNAGVSSNRIALDPGFGFGKTTAHNIELTQQLGVLSALGLPVVAGWSRKRTIGELTGQADAKQRVTGSVAAALACVARGARIVRVHDVRETVDALKVWFALNRSS